MNEDIRKLEPKVLWNHFCDLNAVPRASKKEEQVIEFMVNFGKSLGFPTKVDAVGNVIIKKPATKGLEDRKVVVLQSHLDMVHQKNADTKFDFATEGIKMLIDGDWVRAKGTTLGADNGIGVAAIMSILASDNIPHPTIEALFTIDEETGMTGAIGLQGGELDGDILLNLDTEEDDEIDIGCAGGIDVSAQSTYNEVNTPANHIACKIKITGLNGGHSGMQIHEGLGNANKLMNRVLYSLKDMIRIASIDGGGLRNAIPRESVATLTIIDKKRAEFVERLHRIIDEIKEEFKTIEPDLEIITEEIPTPQRVMTTTAQEELLNTIGGTFNGVFRMSPDIEGLVEASNNLARVIVKDGDITIHCLTRSSVESSKLDVANTLRAVFELAGYECTFSGSYPGWKPNPDSPILTVMKDLYEKMFKETPKVVACHAGLECGILGTNYPKMDMISFGPTIKGAHSPDERTNIKSVQKFWDFLLHILENIPKK